MLRLNDEFVIFCAIVSWHVYVSYNSRSVIQGISQFPYDSLSEQFGEKIMSH